MQNSSNRRQILLLENNAQDPQFFNLGLINSVNIPLFNQQFVTNQLQRKFSWFATNNLWKSEVQFV